MVEKYLHYYNVNYGLSCIALRYANVFGPRQDPLGEAGVISIFLGLISQNKSPQIFGDGTQTRDYIYVGDVVTAHLAAMSYQGKNWRFNIGTGKEISVLDLMDVMRTVSGRDVNAEHVDPVKGEVYKIALDPNFTKSELDWDPKTDITAGMKKVWDWMNGSS